MAHDVTRKDLLSTREKEFANIMFWVLGRQSISAEQIKVQFKMGNRAYSIIDELNRLNVVSDKHGNLTREVIPKSLEELSSEAMNLLEQCGYTADSINNTFDSKNSNVIA